MSAPPENISLTGLRVLIAEDEIIVAFDLQDLLEDAGATVIGPACTLDAAVKLANGNEVDCAILDVQLGPDTVIPLAAILEDRKIPFVFHTGNAQLDELQSMWPGSEVLAKPIQHGKLLSKIREMAARH